MIPVYPLTYEAIAVWFPLHLPWFHPITPTQPVHGGPAPPAVSPPAAGGKGEGA